MSMGPVFGMVRDKGQVVLVQTRVEGVENRAGARDSEIRFEVLIRVPSKGADPFTIFYSELLQGYGELFGTGDEIGVGVAVERLIRAAGNDLPVSVELLRAPQNVRQG